MPRQLSKNAKPDGRKKRHNLKKTVPKNAILIPDKAQKVFSGNIFDTYQWEQEMFDGTTKTFEMLRRPDTVEIIAIKDGKIVVLEEEQPNLPVHYTIPAGRHDVPGENELQAAQRELAEEAGLYYKNWKLINVVQPVAKIEWFIYQFIATDLDREETHKPESDGEKIKVMFKALDEVKSMLNHPRNRYLPKELISDLSSLDDLVSLPEFVGKEVDR